MIILTATTKTLLMIFMIQCNHSCYKQYLGEPNVHLHCVKTASRNIAGLLTKKLTTLSPT